MEAYTKTKVTKSQNAILYMKPCTKSNVKIITKKYATRSRKNNARMSWVRNVRQSRLPSKKGNVTMLMSCFALLKQTVQYEEVPAVFTVQKCHTAIE